MKTDKSLGLNYARRTCRDSHNDFTCGQLIASKEAYLFAAAGPSQNTIICC